MKNKKLFVIIAVVLFVLVAGIIGLGFFLNTDNKATKNDKEDNQNITIETENITETDYVPTFTEKVKIENDDIKDSDKNGNSQNSESGIKTEADDLEIMLNPENSGESNKVTKATEKKSTKATEKKSDKNSTKATENNSDKENKTEATTQQKVQLPFVPAE